MNLISSSIRIQKDAIKFRKFHNLPQSFHSNTTSDFVYRSQKHALSSNDCGHILQSLTSSKSLKMGQTLHGYVVSSGLLQNNTYLCTKIAVFYATCGCMNAARIIFDQIVNKSCFLWNFMIRGYASNGFSTQAISLYRKMMRIGVVSDNFTYPFVIKACGDLVHVYLGRIVHAQAVVNGFQFNLYVANCLVEMYVRFRDMENARKVFDGMPKRDLTSWNTIISGYAEYGNLEAARIFREMLVMDSTIDSMQLESGLWQGGGSNGGGGGHPELGMNVVWNSKDCEYDETKLYIAYLPRKLEDKGLISLFSAFGEIVMATVVKERGTHMGKGYGFVKYANVDQANAAIAGMNGRSIEGRRIAVRIAGKPPQPPPPQPQSSDSSPPAPYPSPPPGSSYYPPSVQTHIMQSQRRVYGSSPVGMAHTHPRYIRASYASSQYYGAAPPAKQPQVMAIVPRASNLPRRPLVGRLLRELIRNKGSSWQK